MILLDEEVAETMRCCNTDRYCAVDRCMAWQGQTVQQKDGSIKDTHKGYCKMVFREDERIRFHGGPG